MREHVKTTGRSAAILLVLCLPGVAGSCGQEGREQSAAIAAAAPSDELAPRYLRDYLYLGERNGAPLVVPFAFRAIERGDSIERTARGGLAHGETWDPFIDETWSTQRESGVWRILPHGELRMAVGGPADLEAFWFQRGERSLRLELERPLSAWHEGNATRYRLIAGRLRLGAESTRGVILESLQVRRPGAGARDSDVIFVTSGDSIRLLIGESPQRERQPSRGFAIGWLPQGERSWERAEIRWLERRAFDEARRDIPLHWRFQIPEAGIMGEVSALGMDARAGRESPGRRAVEIHYTVEGWIEIDQIRSPIIGVVRHVQE
jgi:hypothetical protein